MKHGAHGTFSHGKLSQDDEGDCGIAVVADKDKGLVILDFGKDLSWIGLYPKNIRELINLLHKTLEELE